MTSETGAYSTATATGHDAVSGATGPFAVVLRLVSVCLMFIALFSACWIGAFHAPVPHDMPIGLVGMSSPPASSATTAHRFTSESALRDAVAHGEVTGGLALQNGRATIWTAKAQGRQTEQYVLAYLSGLARRHKADPAVHSLAPFAPGDPAGVGPFFVVLSLLVPALIAGAVIGSIRMRRRLAGVAALIGFSAAAYLVDWLIVSLWLGAITGSAVGYASVVTLYALAVSATAAGLAAWGRPLIALVGALFLGLGVPATGGPAAVGFFLPAFFQRLGPFLPPSAAIEGIRSGEWFGGSDIISTCLVLGIWSLAGIAALLAKRGLVLDQVLDTGTHPKILNIYARPR